MTFLCLNKKCKEVFPTIFKINKCLKCGSKNLERILPEVEMKCEQCTRYSQELLNVNVIKNVIVDKKRKKVVLKQKVCFICLRKLVNSNLIKWKGTYWIKMIYPNRYKNNENQKRNTFKRNSKGGNKNVN